MRPNRPYLAALAAAFAFACGGDDPAPGPQTVPSETPRAGDLVTVRENHANGGLATQRVERILASGERVRHGPIEVWHENGARLLEGEYADGKKVGRWRYWNDMGALEREGSYDADRREGTWTEWWPNGQKRSEGALHSGMAEGAWKYWHENGQVKAEGDFVGDRREGTWQYWNADGSVDLEHTGVYVNHVRQP